MQQDNPNPYSPPQSEVRDIRPQHEVPADVLKKIKGAYLAGLFSASVTLVFAVFGIQGFDLWYLVDVVLILGLTYGIYRKSRASAIAMLAYFAISKVMIIVQTGAAGVGLLSGLLFLYFYWQGVVGTIAYQKIIRASDK